MHAKEWILFKKNLGYNLSIDETALSNGELYTIITNKAAKGKKGALVAMIAGTKADTIIRIINKIPEKYRKIVKEVTLDMAGSVNKIVRKCFPKATLVIDRFNVQKLAYDAIQEIRIKYRRDAINKETEAILEEQSCPTKNMLPPPMRMGIQKNNCWPEVAIYFSNLGTTGHPVKKQGPKFYSGSLLILKRLTP